MKTYTQGRNQYGVWTKNTDTANLTNGDLYANDDYFHICAMKDWPFLERQRTLSTVSGNQSLTLPYDCDLVKEVAVIPNGQTMRWIARLSPNAQHWDQLNLVQFTSDNAQWYRVIAGQLQLWPIPASTGNTVNINQKTRPVALSQADYTTGTITTLTNGTTTVTGSGTAWNASMVGRYLQIASTSAANGGDNLWYEIAGVASSTSLTLVRAYGGTSISAGSASYTIGQAPLLPEAFHDTIWKQAAATYWAKETDGRSDKFQAWHDRDLLDLVRQYSSPTGDFVIDDGRERDNFINPNLTVTL